MKNEIVEVLSKIEELGYKAYIVGGYPRDFYIGKDSDDYDICTDAKPEIIIGLFDAIAPEKHGSVKIKYKGITFDITTFRLESEYLDVRTPITAYTTSLEEDLYRRDFTINAICMNKEGEYIDLLGGLEDIDSKLIRCIGDPGMKLADDPLRILRAIRFATVLDFSIEEELEKALLTEGINVAKLSYFRKKEELDRIFNSENIVKGIELIRKYNLEEYLEINFDGVKVIPSANQMWYQLKYPSNYPFTKNEKKNI